MPLPESDRTAEQNLAILRGHAAASLSDNDERFADSLLEQLGRTNGLSRKQWFWVDQLASRAIKATADYGKRTGKCYLCHRKLTDPKSVRYGYGPICANNNGLPYE